MKLPKLFKNSSKGPLEWTIEVQADAYRTHSGVVGGKITTTAWTFVEGMNIGKSNETAPYDQSVIAAKALWTKKHDNSQYRENINDTDTVYTEPMLAHNYVKRKNSIDFNKGVYVQCKLNGQRCLIKREGAFTRKGKVINGIPHITKCLERLFVMYPDLIIDGEIFNDDLRQDLGSLISLIAGKDHNKEELEKSEQITQFHVYDLIMDKCYSERLAELKKLINIEIKHNPLVAKYIKVVDSYAVNCHDHIDQLLTKFEEQGHEGVMVRINDKPYENKRSYSLLKYKTFITSEFTIVGMEEGVGNLAGKCGAFILENDKGIRFNSAPTGTHELWEQYWKQRDQLIGQLAEVKYKELTPVKNSKGGVPSFGKVIIIRNYD